MVVIGVKKEDKEKVLEILLSNGKFRSLGENKFDIMEHSEEVLEKLEKKGIEIEKIEE